MAAADNINEGTCFVGLGTGLLDPTNPTIPPSGYFDPLQGMQAHLLIPWATLDAAAVGQQISLPVSGPTAPILPPIPDCTAQYGTTCTQSETWQGTVTLTRAA